MLQAAPRVKPTLAHHQTQAFSTPLLPCLTTSSLSVQPARRYTETTTTLVIEEGTISPGFTGKYITEHLNTHPECSGPTPFTFAISRQSRENLGLRGEFGLGDGVGILVDLGTAHQLRLLLPKVCKWPWTD